MKTFIVFGRVTSEADGLGIAGVVVHAVLHENGHDLDSTLTNEEGGYHLIFEEDGIPANDEIEVTARFPDQERAASPKRIAAKFGTYARIEIVADAELTDRHLSRITSLKPKEGSVLPEGRRERIYSAINLYGQTKKRYSLNDPGKPGLMCPFPEMAHSNTGLDDAWGAVQGNPYSVRRFRSALDAVALGIEARQGLRTRIDFDGPEWREYIESRRDDRHNGVGSDHIVPLESGALLMMAARCIAGADQGLANRYMNIVLSQLIEFYAAAPIYRTSRDAMMGDSSAQASLRQMIDIWGEDCEGRSPMPDKPSRGEWDPSKDALEPDLEDMLACLDELASGGRQSEVRPYSIDRLSPADGCPGDIAVISGSGFGSVPGEVLFTGSSVTSLVSAIPTRWTDTEIEIRLPAGATHGSIGLRFPFRTGRISCGRVTSVQHRNVSQEPTYFIGGRPRLDSISFTKNDVPFNPAVETVLPGETVKLIYENSPNALEHIVDVRQSRINLTTGLFDAATSIQETTRTYEPGDDPPRSTILLPGTNRNRSTKITCNIGLTNQCGTTSGTAYFMIHRPANVALTGIEVTQATQFFRAVEHISALSGEQKPDNSVPLVAHKQTLARVYYTTSGNASFNNGLSFGISVALTARKNGNDLGAADLINERPLVATQDNSVETQRGRLTSSANFLLPATWVGPTIFDEPTEPADGGLVRRVNAPLSIEARLSIRDVEPWIRNSVGSVTDPPAEVRQVDGLFFNSARKLEVRLVRYAITTPNDGTFSAPSLDRCMSALTQIAEAYPTHELAEVPDIEPEGFLIDADLTDRSGSGCGTGWDRLLTDLGMRQSLDQNDGGAIWVGMVHGDVPLGAGGCGAEPFRVASFPENRHSTGMQEIGHALGLDHPWMDDPTDNDPTFPDYRGNLSPSIGEFGVAVGDILSTNALVINRLVFDPDDINDFMSRGRNMPLPRDGRWVSPHNYNKLLRESFVGQVGPTAAEFTPGTEAEQILVRGVIDTHSDKIALEPVFHERRPTVRQKGRPSPYTIELSDDSGYVIHRAEILTSRYIGGRKLLFSNLVPYSNNYRFIEVKNGATSLARIERRRESPRIRNLNLEVDGAVWTVTWEVDNASEYWCSVQITFDNGISWTRLQGFVRATSVSVDTSNFPGGNESRLRIVVTDGFNTNYAETKTIALPLRPPKIVPVNFSDGTVFDTGKLYMLKAEPVWTLSAPRTTALHWFLDGEAVGMGRRVPLAFRTGSHEIRIAPDGSEEDALIVEVTAGEKRNSDKQP